MSDQCKSRDPDNQIRCFGIQGHDELHWAEMDNEDGYGTWEDPIHPTKQQVIKENKLCFACNPPDLDFPYWQHEKGKEMTTQEIVFCKYHARYLLSAISTAEYEENKYEE